MSIVARGFPEQATLDVSASKWRVSVTVGDDEDWRFKVPCGDGTLTVEALATEITRRYATLKRDTDDRPSTAVTLLDARGARLFFEDRVCDVLENRARVSARAFASAEGLREARGHLAPFGASRSGSNKRKRVSARDAYARDDASFEYVTPTSFDLLANVAPFSSERAFACPVCVDPARAFAQPQQLQFHIRSHNTARMTAAQRAKVHAAIERMDDRGSRAAGAAAGGLGSSSLGAAPKKERRFFCPNPECEHNPEVEAGAHPFASFKLCRQHYLRRHSAERPHACPNCGRAYAVKADMQTHAKRCAERRAAGSGERV